MAPGNSSIGLKYDRGILLEYGLHAGYLLRRNVRLVTEYMRIFGNDNYGRASVGFVSAF